ncbi:RNA-binding protein 26-like [Amphibalanus amphitrite]|uniref:RNA-binding protein 26-like n=1 Tax=Amphibalanus amphitrite TaxID=1232801 RepID=UPI001C90B642|nr:RNA-binding protein 26-like [Amphibalanus amphitrite]
MIVEKPDALKQWMADILEHMSDAQPTKLARYVLALVRKASSPERLRVTMLEQLDVFLHEETPLFADRLLAALASGVYAVRPAESRVVTLPVAPPPRRLVQLPPEETNSSPGASAVSDRLGDKTNGTAAVTDSPACPNSNGMNASSRDSGSPAENSASNGTSAPASADPRPDPRPDARPDARPSPFTDLRHRLGGSLGRRRGRDANERSIDDSPLEYSPAKVTAPGGPAPLAPFSQPQPPPTAAAAAGE